MIWACLALCNSKTCLPQNTSVSAPNSLCPYFQIFNWIFCGCTTHHSKQNSVTDKFFYHSSCKNSVWTHIFNYTDALHSDFNLFTSVKVVLDRRSLNTFSKSCTVCAAFADVDASFLERLLSVCFLGFMYSSSSSSVSCSHLSLTSSNLNLSYWKMSNFCKVWMQSRCLLV